MESGKRCGKWNQVFQFFGFLRVYATLILFFTQGYFSILCNAFCMQKKNYIFTRANWPFESNRQKVRYGNGFIWCLIFLYVLRLKRAAKLPTCFTDFFLMRSFLQTKLLYWVRLSANNNALANETGRISSHLSMFIIFPIIFKILWINTFNVKCFWENVVSMCRKQDRHHSYLSLISKSILQVNISFKTEIRWRWLNKTNYLRRWKSTICEGNTQEMV